MLHGLGNNNLNKTMRYRMDWLWPALAIVLIVEGIGPLLFPTRWRLYLLQISQMPTNQLRQTGGVLVVIGVVCLFYLS
jgi:uncharacterized protein YjeT (DUF2065 family)|tara:strand:- start:2001 stop:2234 length:234 start_codon:yes stop_codon:yes gene_type:complete